jgi:hypothetical protein
MTFLLVLPKDGLSPLHIYIVSSSKKIVVLHHFIVKIYGPKNVVVSYSFDPNLFFLRCQL